jgi:radical SAM superfamily enzyme YgiQ (UPF0313 family)
VNILFIQLPLSDRGGAFSSGNYPYGPYSIVSYLSKKKVNARTEVMDPLFVNTMNDECIAREAVSRKPGIVSFSVFAWNAERSLRIARRIRNLSDALIFFGGPEVSEGSCLFSEMRAQVHAFVRGEGEWFFEKYLSGNLNPDDAQTVNGNRVIVQPSGELIPACGLCEPYGEGILPYIQGTFAFAEMTRGCPWRCSYCMYSRRARTVREQPDDVLLRAVSRAAEERAAGLYVLSPSLDAEAGNGQRLRKLAETGHGVPLHSEMRTERVTRELADNLFRAGFRSMEVGLQTMSASALEKSGRKSDPVKEMDGMRILRESGIGLKIGLIPGLPGDTPDGFRRTVDALAEKNLAADTEAYPLMILPGTAIRDSAASEGLTYMDKPPYYFLESAAFGPGSVREMRAYLESVSGESSCVNDMPRPSSADAEITGGVVIDCARPFDAAALDKTEPHTQCVTVKVLSAGRAGIVPIVDAARRSFGNGDALISFIVASEEILPDAELLSYAKSYRGDSYFPRSRFYHPEKDSCGIRVFQIFSSAERYLDAAVSYDFIDALLLYSERNAMLSSGEDWLFVPEIFIPSGGYDAVREYAVRYADSPDLVCFENEADMNAFYGDHGLALPQSVLSHRLVPVN